MSFDELVYSLRTMRIPGERRRAIVSYLDSHPDYHITDVLLLPTEPQVEILEVIHGMVREGGRPRVRSELARDEQFRIRTVNGKPLGRVKMGFDPSFTGTTRDERRLARTGATPYLYRDFPAEFVVASPVAVYLLAHFGYGLASPRKTCRNAVLRDEKDACGRPVLGQDRWLLVEAGSVLEGRARDAGDLQPTPTAASAEPAQRRAARS